MERSQASLYFYIDRSDAPGTSSCSISEHLTETFVVHVLLEAGAPFGTCLCKHFHVFVCDFAPVDGTRVRIDHDRGTTCVYGRIQSSR